MNTKAPRHAKKSSFSNIIAIRDKFNGTLLAVWLMMIASMSGLMNSMIVPTNKLFSTPVYSVTYNRTSVSHASVAVQEEAIAIHDISAITETNTELEVYPINELEEIAYENELIEEMNTVVETETTDSNITQIKQEEIIETVTPVVVEEPAPAVQSTNIDEENGFFGYTEEDYTYLLMTIVGEAQNCSREEQMYVGSVVLNRLNSDLFPKQTTIRKVVTAKGQYACFKDGNAYKTPTDTNKEVAMELLKNGSVLPENVVFQALFKQGDGVYCQINKTYFCYVNR